MAAKITLGSRPQNFQRKLIVDLPEGKGEITLLYKYRTRKEFGAFIDGLVAKAKMQPPTITADRDANDEAMAGVLAQIMAATVETNADYLMDVLDGWGLPDEFTKANVQQLCDELPGVALRIIEDYRHVTQDGRLGN